MASKPCTFGVTAMFVSSLSNHRSVSALNIVDHWVFCPLFRLHLAALHFNENSDRRQATKQDGEARYAISKPKYKPGAATAKAIKEGRTYSKSLKRFT